MRSEPDYASLQLAALLDLQLEVGLTPLSQ